MSMYFFENFGRACGLAGPVGLLVSKAGEDRPVRHQLDQPFALIGRAGQTDVVLDDPSVSRRHAYLQSVGGQILCVDLGSRTGVRWPDGRRRAGWLRAGEPIVIGVYTVTLLSHRSDPNAPALQDGLDPLTARPADAANLDPLSLEVSNKTGSTTHWAMPQSVALAGRAGACAIRAADDKLSPFHCAFVKAVAGLWVVDLLSEGGTRVNGESARAARLKDGDLVRAGGLTVLVRADAPANGKADPLGFSLGSSALVSLSPAHVPASVESVVDTVNTVVNPLHDLMRQFQECLVVMTKMFATVQQEQLALQREQMLLAREQMAEFQQAARDYRDLRAELAATPYASEPPPAPYAEVAADRPAESVRPGATHTQPAPPRPKPLAPSAATELANAHEWLVKRLADMERQLGSTNLKP